jgi:DNA-binding NarL/FixJ family response regulator
MNNILLITNCYLVRCALSTLINANDDMCMAAAVSDWKDARDEIESESFDIVVLDLSMPRTNGLETLSALRYFQHQLSILIISGEDEPEYALNCLKLGCKGYLTRRCTENQVMKAIYGICSGETCIMPVSFRRVVESRFRKNKVFDGLSLREIQIFLKLARGQATELIAGELNITSSTVSVFKSNIIRKMRFKNNVDIIHYALDHHLVDVSDQTN